MPRTSSRFDAGSVLTNRTCARRLRVPPRSGRDGCLPYATLPGEEDERCAPCVPCQRRKQRSNHESTVCRSARAKPRVGSALCLGRMASVCADVSGLLRGMSKSAQASPDGMSCNRPRGRSAGVDPAPGTPADHRKHRARSRRQATRATSQRRPTHDPTCLADLLQKPHRGSADLGREARRHRIYDDIAAAGNALLVGSRRARFIEAACHGALR